MYVENALPVTQEKNKRIKAIVGAASGNLVEWFDFYIYAVFASYFQKALTAPYMTETAQAIYVWGVFAAGFFMRPIGSWLFGWIGDRYGRKNSMMISILLMCASSFCFALLPTYAQIGGLAPFLLLMVRLLQGLSVGGEYGAVATYMSEVALAGRRGFFASFQYVTLAGGQLLASLLGVVLLQLMTETQIQNGGWRIPFVIGGVAALVSLWVRNTLEETTTEEDRNNEKSGSIVALFRECWRPFLIVCGFTAGGSLSFYTISVYSKTYLTGIGVDGRTVGYIMTLSLFVFMIAQPIFGSIADRIGRRASMLAFSGLGALCIYPIMVMGMQSMYNHPIIICGLLIMMLFILSFYTSIGGLVKAEMFPTELRALGVGLSYAIANAIFGGSAPTVALKFKSLGYENYFFGYVIIMLVICFCVSWFIPSKPKYLNDEY